MIRVRQTRLYGCFEIQTKVVHDLRGRFAKIFHGDLYQRKGLRTDFLESYYTTSRHGVLRGLHFQTPPHDHAKVVHCVSGTIFDAAVDLVVGSPTYGQHTTFILSPDKANSIYLSAGLAHGFYVLSKYAVVVYYVTSLYSPHHDGGILWNSAGIRWPNNRPIISERDKSLISLKDFSSPFRITR